MPPLKSKDKLSSHFPFLNKNSKEDIELYEIYKEFKIKNGKDKHTDTIRDMIKVVGNVLDLYQDRLLLSVKHNNNEYEVEVIDTTIRDKGD